MGVKTASKQVREHMDLPAGVVLNLDELSEYLRDGQPSVMSVGRRERPGKAGPGVAEAKIANPASSNILVRPLRLGGAVVVGLPGGGDNLGVVLDGKRYHFNMMLSRGEKGSWSPDAGAPLEMQWTVVDGEAVPQGPDVVRRVLEVVSRGVELVYGGAYREFVLAELSWYNNGILGWEEAAEKVRTKKASQAERDAFYKIRFSGQMAALKEGEKRILDWLREHPAEG